MRHKTQGRCWRIRQPSWLAVCSNKRLNTRELFRKTMNMKGKSKRLETKSGSQTRTTRLFSNRTATSNIRSQTLKPKQRTYCHYQGDPQTVYKTPDPTKRSTAQFSNQHKKQNKSDNSKRKQDTWQQNSVNFKRKESMHNYVIELSSWRQKIKN